MRASGPYKTSRELPNLFAAAIGTTHPYLAWREGIDKLRDGRCLHGRRVRGTSVADFDDCAARKSRR